MKHTKILAACALLLPACAAPPPARTAATLQADAAARLALAAGDDAAALRASVEALLNIRAAAIAHECERSIASLLLTPAGDPDHDALDADLALSSPATALAQTVRAGRMTARDAHDWLHDYALALRMTAAPAPRAHLLARLDPLREHDDEAAALLAALDRRAEATRRLARDAASTADALRAWTESPAPLSPEARDLLLDLWRSAHAPDTLATRR